MGLNCAQLASSASVLTVAPPSFLGDAFNGFMDEVRIWSTAKTEAAVVTQMHLSLAAAEPGLEAYYQFNYPAGVTSAVADSSANGLDACLLGGAAEVPTVITPYAAPVYMQDVAVKEKTISNLHSRMSVPTDAPPPQCACTAHTPHSHRAQHTTHRWPLIDC